jgi:hypothetical protein
LKFPNRFREHYTCSTEKKSFITHEEILSEYLKSHPEAGPLSTITIGKMIKFVWNDTVKCCRRRVHDVDGKTRKQGYFTLVRKTPCQETTTLSKSILHLPAAEIVVPGWSVECLYKQHGIRYRKPIQQFYINNHAAMLEVYFSFHDDQADDGINNGNDEVDKEETCKSNATLLCHGRVINAEELDLWDNKWVPTLKKVQVLLDVIGNSSICFGYDMEESWSTEFLNSNERTVVVHKCFEDVISNNGQRKLMSVDCKILSTMIGSYCDHCCHVMRTVSRRELRKKTANNKDQTYRNNSKMTRKELEDKLNKIQSELQKSKYRERSLLKKLSDINGTIVNNYDGIESEDSDSSSAHEG